MSPKSDMDPDRATMSLSDHLEDLRRRLIYALLGVAAASVVTFWFGRDIVLWLCQPLFEAEALLHLPRQTVNLSVAGGFMVYVKVSMIAALALAAPWVVYQLWKFVAPGLYASERRVLVMIGPFSLAMSALAVLFMYYLFLPAAISFLLLFSANYPPPSGQGQGEPTLRTVTKFFNWVNGFLIPGGGAPPASTQGFGPATQPAGAAGHGLAIPVLDHDPAAPVEGEMWFNSQEGEIRVALGGQVRRLSVAAPSMMVPLIDINQYLDFVLLLGLIMVIAFQLPVVMTILGAAGVLEARQLARWRKYIVFGCFVVGVVITPNQDVVSNIVFPLLLWGLFELGLVTMRIVSRPVEQEADEG